MNKFFLLLFSVVSSVVIQGQQAFYGVDAERKYPGMEIVREKPGLAFPEFLKPGPSIRLDGDRLNHFLKSLIQKKGLSTDLRLVSKDKDAQGFIHLTFQHYINNVPVEAGMYKVHLKDYVWHSAHGNLFAVDPNANAQASIGADAAVQSAIHAVPAQVYKWEVPEEEADLKFWTNHLGASYYPSPSLCWVAPQGDFHGQKLRLAWKMDVYAHQPLARFDVFVDAQSGEVLWLKNKIHTADSLGSVVTAYSGTHPMTADFFNGQFRLRETGRGNGIQTFDLNNGTSYGNATDFLDADNIWNNVNASLNQYAGDAHWGAEMTYDYFLQIHNRNSIDGNGFMLRSYVHYSNNYNNAFWDGQRMTYGDGDGSVFTPLTALDITGHEIAHGLTSNTANLIYQNESGALNESFSDIFGMAVTAYASNTLEWTIGEDATPNGNGIRSMSNPNAYNDPDCYGGSFYYTGSQDNGGVHTNSGVQNYWFYLMTVGGTGTNDLGNTYSVNAQGVIKAAEIAFRNLTVYLGPSSNHQDARFYAIQSAIDLYGACTPEVIATTNAWHAVGVGGPFSATVTANFSTPFQSFCQAPAMVSFTNTSVNAGNFIWDFGDGTTSTQVNPTHTYAQPGSYNVKLIADGGACGMDSIIQSSYIIVDPNLPCNITMNPNGTNQTQFSCTGTLFDPGGPSGNYQDNLNSVITIAPTGAATVSLQFSQFNLENNYDYLYIFDGPSINSPLIGQYTGNTLPNGGTITSTAGAITLRMFSDVYVNELGFVLDWSCQLPSTPPVPDFLATALTSCDGDIQFQDMTTNGAVSWFWDFGDGQSSTQQNPQHQYQQDGTYSVKLVATNLVGSDSIVKPAYITIDRPDAPQGNDVYLCQPDTAHLSAAALGTVYWYTQLGATNPVATGPNFSTYVSVSDTFWVENQEAQMPSFVGPLDNSFGGGGFHNNSSTQYLIFDVDQPTTLVSAWVNANSAGNRSFILWDGSGNQLDSRFVLVPAGTSRVALNFHLQPGVNYRLGGSDMDLYRNNSGVNYPYNPGGHVEITGSSAGAAYYYYLYDWELQGDPCISPRVPIRVEQGPVISGFSKQTTGLSVQFTATSSNASFYQWDFGDGQSSTLANPLHTYTQAGTYTVQLISGNPSCSDTVTDMVTVQVSGIENALTALHVQLYPNPFTDQVWIKGALMHGVWEVQLLDLRGRLLSEQALESTGEQVSYALKPLQGLAPGTYLLRLRHKASGTEQSLRLVKRP